MAGGFFNPFPKYLQIRSLLLRRLQQEYAPGDRFPTEHALCDEFGVSRETVRDALRLLEEEDLIERRRGHGTTVVRRPAKPESRLTGLVEDFTELKLDTFTRLLAKRVVPAPPDVSDALGVPEGEPIFLIQRLRVLGGAPLARHDAYLPVEIGVPLSRSELSRTTVSSELRSTFGLEIWEDYQEIDATVADADVAALLEVAVGSPLLLVRRRYLAADGSPAALFHSCFRSDRYYATIKMPKPARRRRGSSRRTVLQLSVSPRQAIGR